MGRTRCSAADAPEKGSPASLGGSGATGKHAARAETPARLESDGVGEQNVVGAAEALRRRAVVCRLDHARSTDERDDGTCGADQLQRHVTDPGGSELSNEAIDAEDVANREPFLSR